MLGYGSGGTVVFSGELDGRPVAVKRMLRQFYEVARKEIGALILADEHPNIVRWDLPVPAVPPLHCAQRTLAFNQAASFCLAGALQWRRTTSLCTWRWKSARPRCRTQCRCARPQSDAR